MYGVWVYLRIALVIECQNVGHFLSILACDITGDNKDMAKLILYAVGI